jgi:hypothetical protein
VGANGKQKKKTAQVKTKEVRENCNKNRHLYVMHFVWLAVSAVTCTQPVLAGAACDRVCWRICIILL